MPEVSEFADRLGESVAHAGAALATLLEPPQPPEQQAQALQSYRSSLERLQQALLEPEQRESEQAQAALGEVTQLALKQARGRQRDRSDALTESIGALGVTIGAFAAGRQPPARSEPILRGTALALADATVAASEAPVGGSAAPPAAAPRDAQDFKPVVAALVRMVGDAEDEDPTAPVSEGFADVLPHVAVLAGSSHKRASIHAYGTALARCLRSGDQQATREAAATIGARAWIEGVSTRAALSRSLDAFAAAVRVAEASDAGDPATGEMTGSLLTALGLAAAAEGAVAAGEPLD